jgi:phosphatidate phosphatase APP1
MRLAHVLARPVRKDRGSGGFLIQPYRGFGSPDEIFLMGRVYRQPRVGQQMRTTSARRDFLDVIRRVLRRGVAGAMIRAEVAHPKQLAKQNEAKNGACQNTDCLHEQNEAKTNVNQTHVQADNDGYFRVLLHPHPPLTNEQQWHSITLELLEPQETQSLENAHENRSVQGHVYIPPDNAKRVIISDIDDTVMYTGVVNKVKMMWRLFMQGPHSRVAFPGVASLYRGLHLGPSGDEYNPMLYVSRAPWGIYEILQEFFRIHRIPNGPILFLREWGITWRSPLPRRAEDHKFVLIRQMIELYHDYPFVLIGDSGQHDPEIYAQIVKEYPGRVEAVYIRNVTHSKRRNRAIEALAKRVIDSGSSLVLASDSFSMAKHAADHGLINAASMREVLQEHQAEPESTPPAKTIRLGENSESETKDAIDQGELEEALEENVGRESPANVIVESRKR